MLTPRHSRSDVRRFGRLRILFVTLCAMLCALSAATAEIPGYVVLPLVPMGRNNQATLRFTINGHRTMLILDTGASTTVLDEGFYREMHSKTPLITATDLPPGVRKNLNANGQAAEIGTIDSLVAGGTEFGKRRVLLTDLSKSFARYNNLHATTSVAGLLGEDFLHQHAALIDWARRGVYFNTNPTLRLKLGPSLAAAGWTGVPMARTSGNHFAVSCTVSGKPVRLLVDTGAQFTSFVAGVVPLIMVYNRDARGSMNRINSSAITMSMIGMDSNSYAARVENWKIGNYPVQSSNIVVGKMPAGLLTQQSAGEGPVLGLLGAEFLAANNAIVDIGGETLYLKHK